MDSITARPKAKTGHHSERIREWLLTSSIQLSEGGQAGGIGGWIDEKGRVPFAYAEITGYYLSAMAHTRTVAPLDTRALERAVRAFDWLERQFHDGALPETYTGLDRPINDWRNDVVFSFDLAMMLQGVSALQGMVCEDRRQRLAHRILDELSRFLSEEGEIVPWRTRGGKTRAQVPARWSTCPGPHHAKTAAVILLATESGSFAPLIAAARRTFDFYRSRLPATGSDYPLHPFFYYLEGLTTLSWRRDDALGLDLAGASFTSAIHGWFHGEKPNGRPRSREFARSDTLAQALRLGHILAALDRVEMDSWRGVSDSLASTLARCIEPSGAVRFYLPGTAAPLHLNAAGSIFAWQALYLHENGGSENAVELVLSNFA